MKHVSCAFIHAFTRSLTHSFLQKTLEGPSCYYSNVLNSVTIGVDCPANACFASYSYLYERKGSVCVNAQGQLDVKVDDGPLYLVYGPYADHE